MREREPRGRRNKHIEHTPGRNYQCAECKRVFGRRANLKRHVGLVHEADLARIDTEGVGYPVEREPHNEQQEQE